MYNRYLDASPASRAVDAEPGPPPQRPASAAPPPPPPSAANAPWGHSDLLGGLTGGIGQALGGIVKNFSLENLDTGDILLILIILFLFLEGDDLEIAITLGLMLILGLGDD